MLTKRGAEILVRLEHMMDDASRAMGPPPPPSVSADKKKQADMPPAPATRWRRLWKGGRSERN